MQTATQQATEATRYAQLSALIAAIIEALRPEIFASYSAKQYNFWRRARRWGFLWVILKKVDQAVAVNMGGPEHYVNGQKVAEYFLREDGKYAVSDTFWPAQLGARPVRFLRLITPSFETLLHTIYNHLWFIASLGDHRKDNVVVVMTEEARASLDPQLYQLLRDQQRSHGYLCAC